MVRGVNLQPSPRGQLSAVVDITPSFFDQLDDQLRPERGPDGEPSAADFVVMKLPDIVERFATGFDRLPTTIEGLEDARMVIAPGLLVRDYVVYAVLADRGVVELIAVSVEE